MALSRADETCERPRLGTGTTWPFQHENTNSIGGTFRLGHSQVGSKPSGKGPEAKPSSAIASLLPLSILVLVAVCATTNWGVDYFLDKF